MEGLCKEKIEEQNLESQHFKHTFYMQKNSIGFYPK